MAALWGLEYVSCVEYFGYSLGGVCWCLRVAQKEGSRDVDADEFAEGPRMHHHRDPFLPVLAPGRLSY